MANVAECTANSAPAQQPKSHVRWVECAPRRRCAILNRTSRATTRKGVMGDMCYMPASVAIVFLTKGKVQACPSPNILLT